MAFEKLASYREINGGAHRKPPSIVGAPSIVRHLAFWYTPPGDIEDGEEPFRGSHGNGTPYDPQHQQRRRQQYKQYLEALELVLAVYDVKTSQKTEISGGSKRPDSELGRGAVDIYRFWWYGLRTTIRLEMETEYISLTSIIDLSVKNEVFENDLANPKGPAFDLLSAISQLKDSFDGRVTLDKVKLSATRKCLQDAVWVTLDEEIVDHIDNENPILGLKLGKVFADFRGLITGSAKLPTSLGKALSGLKAPSLFRKPFLQQHPRCRTSDMLHDKSDDVWRRDAIRRLWPLIEQDSADLEFTASGYLNGRTVFITGLGPKPGEHSGEASEDGSPVHYYLHVYTDDEWQIGRLLDRIHNLGTLRLAATVKIGALTQAGEFVEQVASLIEDADRVIREAMRDATSECGDAIMVMPDEAMGKIQDHIKKITKLFPLGISYRLERSQYYVDRFNKGTGLFRVKRIEGFQVYNEFIARRLSGIFGYLELLHHRMDTVWTELSQLQAKYATLKTTVMTCNIRSLTSSIRHEDNEIKKIQHFGEVALVGILLPYYLGHLIYYALIDVFEPMESLYWMIVITLSFGISIYDLSTPLKPEQDDSDWQEYLLKRRYWRNGFASLIIMAWLVFLPVYFGIIKYEDEAQKTVEPTSQKEI